MLGTIPYIYCAGLSLSISIWLDIQTLILQTQALRMLEVFLWERPRKHLFCDHGRTFHGHCNVDSSMHKGQYLRPWLSLTRVPSYCWILKSLALFKGTRSRELPRPKSRLGAGQGSIGEKLKQKRDVIFPVTPKCNLRLSGHQLNQ